MEYKVYKNYDGEKEDRPSFSLGQVFYEPDIDCYTEHAATLIIEGDKYRIEGHDEEIKSILLNEIKMSGGNALMRREGQSDGHICIDFQVTTPFDHPEFKKALKNSIDDYGYTAVSPEALNMVQVSSLEEAEKLRSEYLRNKEAKV